MKIDRASMLTALHEFIRSGSGLVIGDPGSGKSHALGQVAERLDAEGTAYLFVLVDDLAEASEQDIQDALGYSEPTFREALDSLFATTSQGGIIIIDGFDAARTPKARSRVLNVVRTAVRMAPPQWSVVVSVRTYDATTSQTLLKLFPAGKGTNGPPRAAVPVRHFRIPALTEREVASALASSVVLKKFWYAAPGELRELVRNPFNLWLLENVFDAGSGLGQISPLRSQTELLLLFWQLRVGSGALSEERILLLKQIVDLMVADGVMAVHNARVFNADGRPAWDLLHSSGILKRAGPGGDRVAFSHNILFDFAVSLLGIQDSPREFVNFLNGDVSRPLFLRPSLLHFFARQWSRNRGRFWDLLWALLPHDEVPIRLVARLIPPYVAATEARAASDLDPLLERLRRGDLNGATAALRILQALRFAGIREVTLWLDVIERMSQFPSKEFAWEMARTLGELAESNSAPESSQVGRIASALFEWAWNHRSDHDRAWYDHLASTLVLPTLLAQGDLEAIQRVVPRILDLLDEPKFPIRYFMTLCDTASRLASVAPSLAEDLYERVFLHEETSEEATPLGGVIIPMRSTRRQDFELCHYQLEKEFGVYLKAEPESAIRTALRLLDQLLQQRLSSHLRPGHSIDELAFEVRIRGEGVALLEDLGDEWSIEPEEVRRLADAAQEKMEVDPSVFAPAELIEFFRREIRCVSVWSRLFKVGAAHPRLFGEPLSSIASDPGILSRQSIGRGIIPFIRNSYSVWPESRRRTLEAFVLDEQKFQEHIGWRGALLEAVPEDGIIFEATKTAKGEQGDREFGRAWVPAERVSARAVEWNHEEELLKSAGVDVTHPKIITWRETAEHLNQFSREWHNVAPDEAAVADVIPHIQELRDAVRPGADIEGVLIHQLWTALAEAAETASRLDSARQGKDHLLLRSILLEAATRFDESRSVQNPQEYRFVSWSPSPRTEAAKGLSRFLFDAADEEIQRALEGLLNSRDPAERAVTLLYLPPARKHSEEWYSAQVRDIAMREQSPGVARAAFRAVAFLGPDRDEVARTLIARWTPAAVGDDPELTRAIGDWLTYLVFRREDHQSTQLLESLTREPASQDADLLGEVVTQSLHLLHLERFAAEDREVVARIVLWVVRLVDTLRQRVADASGDKLDAWRGVAHELVDRVVSRTYFNLRNQDEDPALSAETAREYYHAVKPVLAAVVRFVGEEKCLGMVPRTAHHFVELMNDVLAFEPRQALAMTRAVTQAAGAQGYHLDSLAVREVVRFVESLLSDYRDVLLANDALDDLLGLLDLFAQVGWPEALRLVWRLDEIFR